eukprot:gnl/MRDRNA2_/MRDRNA2_84496_c0_seq1.p1 gnl/MRDRNA2_/MRDRNA2_84496_c0~~gnl/MRDRNA2_/MRDRNA2_84496_c0_seq1.p1  ORF type:complete len:237 (-),score=12.04 gnl/MRDRNA2_/MRDRNA2_84496_c0_seq1:38-724(-)
MASAMQRVANAHAVPAKLCASQFRTLPRTISMPKSRTAWYQYGHVANAHARLDMFCASNWPSSAQPCAEGWQSTCARHAATTVTCYYKLVKLNSSKLSRFPAHCSHARFSTRMPSHDGHPISHLELASSCRRKASVHYSILGVQISNARPQNVQSIPATDHDVFDRCCEPASDIQAWGKREASPMPDLCVSKTHDECYDAVAGIERVDSQMLALACMRHASGKCPELG